MNKTQINRPSNRPSNRSGQCLCGKVSYTIYGDCRDIVLCHCQQCLRFHGYHGAYTAVARQDIKIADTAQKLAWYQSSAEVTRGFCNECGASLFWSKQGLTTLSVAAGSLTQPTKLNMIAHIFTEQMADYDTICDDLQQYDSGLQST